MKTAIKLLLINFAVTQILIPFLVMVPYTLYSFITTGSVNQGTLAAQIPIVPIQLLGIAAMLLYLWKGGYISRERVNWSPVSPGYLGWSALATLCAAWLISVLMDFVDWLPDIMEQTFDVLRSGWAGILTISVVGPVFEELLFRGAVTRALLRQNSPRKAILLSALLFGVFHLNPAQMLPAFLMGILLAWVYYKTASLIPCILMHILNNTLSVYLSMKFPGVDKMYELVDNSTWYLLITVVALLLAVVSYYFLRRVTVPYPWKREEDVEILN